ncbi:MAG TPA: NAD(P)H-binding protein, partial [Anaerolineales bacterium]
LNHFAKDAVLDSVAGAEAIGESNLDWTIVRYPRLTDGDHTRRYRVGFVSRNSGRQISCADGADFILKELVKKKWLRKIPLVSY